MAKYLLQVGAMGVDYWCEKGKIALNETTSQEDLAYLHSINYDGVIKVETQDKAKK